MAIKKLQNNFTTPEQSKRLLELGVPADSADLYTSLGFENLTWIRNTKNELSKDFFDALINGKSANIPIWSVGRLIEIISLCYNWNESLDVRFTGGCLGIPRYTHKNNYLGGAIGFIVREIEKAIMTKSIDFSKLEE